MKEPEPKISIKLPHEMQIDLKRVYAALPKREAVIPSHIDFSSLSDIEKSGYFSILTDNETRRINSELSVKQKNLLGNLLSQAQITPKFRYAISEEFDYNFRRGLETTKSNYIFNILGITEINSHHEGIFSRDKNIRKEIEIYYHNYLKTSIESLIAGNIENNKLSVEQKRIYTEEIKAHKSQFLNLYFGIIYSERNYD